MSAKSKLFIRWAAVFVLVAVLLGGLAGRAQALEIDHSGNIAAGTTIDDDLVMAANDVVMAGTINGTLIAAGNTVTISGTVKSDVIAAGRYVLIDQNAVVEGNLFVGASTVVVRGKIEGTVFGGAGGFTLGNSASVGRNLFYGGFDLTAQAGSILGRDLYAATYQTTLDGQVRNANIAAAAIVINGTISGNAVLRVADTSTTSDINSYRFWSYSWPDLPAPIQPGLRISEGAKIVGKLTYTSETNQGSSIQAVPGGGIVYQTPVPNTTRTERINIPQTYFNWSGFWLWAMLRNLATIIILGALALWLAPRIIQRALVQLQQRTLASLAVGLLSLVVVLFAIPMVAIGLVLLGLLFGVTTLFDLAGIIFGLGFATYGLALALFFTLFLWAGKVLLSLVIGRWVINRLTPQVTVQPFWALVLGAVIFALLAAIPFAGFLFTFLVDLAGAGALWYVWQTRRAS
jgi:cytoskeletal protein CcmA (bactofilin family)